MALGLTPHPWSGVSKAFRVGILSTPMQFAFSSLARVLRAAADECDAIAAEQQAAKQRVPRDSDLLSLSDCGIPVRSLRAVIKTGELPASKVGREYLVRRADLEAYLSARRVQPKAAEPRPLSPAKRAIQRARQDGSLRYVGGNH